jgi:hypothetical protein
MESKILRPRRGTESHGLAKTYRATCAEGHTTEVGLDALQEFLEGNTCPTQDEDGFECGSEIQDLDPEDVLLQCQFCDHHDIFHWQELNYSCDQCPGGEPVDDAMQVGGAYSTRADLATDFYDFEIETGWRKTRPDHWECVAHFTGPDSFARILRERRIRASSTGYYRMPAVCLTEVPIAWASDLRSRFGAFGFVFYKSALLQAGGAPAVNLPENLIAKGLPDAIRPFVNKIGSNFNFLHEREWRTPSDLIFDPVRPMLVLPLLPLQFLHAFMTPEDLANACQEFGVIEHWPSNASQ